MPASCCELESPTRRLTFRYPSVLIPQSPNVSSSMNVAPVLRNVSSVSRSLEVHACLPTGDGGGHGDRASSAFLLVEQTHGPNLSWDLSLKGQ